MTVILRHRARIARLLAAAAAISAVLALVLSYAGRAVLRSRPFAERATAALRDPAVQGDVADHLTDAVVQAHGDLVAVRPLIRIVSGAIVASPAFAAVFQRAVLEAHVAVVAQRRSQVLVNVADAAVLIQATLRRLAPGAAATVGAENAIRLFNVAPPAVVRDVVHTARSVYSVSWALGLAAALLALGALWLSADRARLALRLGASLVLGGLFVIAVYLVGGQAVRQVAPDGRGPAAGAVWRVLAGGLRTEAMWLAGAGAVVMGAAACLTARDGERITLRSVGERAVGRLRAPLVRALVAVAAGVAILLEPGAALSLAAVAMGLLVLAIGVTGALRWASASRRQLARSVAGAGESARERLSVARRAVLRRLLPIPVALLAVAVAGGVIASGEADEAPAVPSLACNGYAELCARHLNDVALAATHNSFASVTIPGFLFGQQDGSILDQLQFGIRGFLIDTYYGFPTKERVRTDTASLPKRAVVAAELGEAAVKAAESIRGRLGSQPTGPRGIYLCHGFCELGAVPLSSALADLRSFLVGNPGEIVMIVNQDEGVAPADIAAAFHQAGLDDLIYRGPLDPFPTLRAMVDSGQRVVVMAENDAGEIPWYHPAYERDLQETPFRFTASADLTDPARLQASCATNRGPDSAPLFLLNNWVDTTPVPRPSNAESVNAYTALLRRAQTCQRLRHRLPNLLAVDFYRRGDVLGVVRTLNRVGS